MLFYINFCITLISVDIDIKNNKMEEKDDLFIK